MRLLEIVGSRLDPFVSMLRTKYDLEDLWIYRSDDNIIKLDSIRVSKDARKSGVGSAVMQEITDYADDNGLQIVLTPGSRDDEHGTTSRNRLVKFYKRFGFRENKGRKKDFTISAVMIRDPQ